MRKEDGETAFPQSLLRGCEAFIKTRTGYTMTLAQKPFTHAFKKEEAGSEPIIDEAYVAEQFVKLCGDYIKRDNEDVYYFDELTGLWGKGELPFRMAVKKHREKLIFKVGDEIYNYGGKEKNIQLFRPSVITFLEDSGFISANDDSARHKLLFSDGIYDFDTGKFSEGFDPSIVFLKRVNRAFPARDMTKINEVNQWLFVAPFDHGTEGKDIGTYWKKALAVGLAGDYKRKKFYLGVGKSNCGKGVITRALKQAFGDCDKGGYVAEWGADNLKYKRDNGGDEAKKLAWTQDLIGARLALSNEARIDRVPLDGNMMKALCGGDEIKARKNHKDQSGHINKAMMVLLVNDIPDVSPKDSGTRTRLRVVEYQVAFKIDADPESPFEREADPEIENKLATTEYKDALVMLMLDTFHCMTPEERKWGGQLVEPVGVEDSTKEWGGQTIDEDVEEHINSKYVITNRWEDCIGIEEFADYILTQKKVRITKINAGKALKSLIKLPDGGTKKQGDLFKGKKRYFGVRERTYAEMEEMDE